MRIAELFTSLQGEGLLAGTESVFVRASGCNLRCAWCDTPYTSWHPEGEEWSVARILGAVTAAGVGHVVLTGGEPLLFADAPELVARCRAAGLHVTVETAGTVIPPTLPAERWADLVSISPKLVSSAPPAARHPTWHRRHQETRRADDVLLRLLDGGPWQLKFVIGAEADIAESLAWLADLERARGAPLDRTRVFLMPEGVDVDTLERIGAWLRPAAAAAGLAYGPRHHVAWFGHRRGT